MRKWNVKREYIPSRFTFYVSPLMFYALHINITPNLPQLPRE